MENTHNKQPLKTKETISSKKSYRPLSFMLEDELLQRIKAYADKEDRNVSSVIRLALKKFLDSEGI